MKTKNIGDKFIKIGSEVIIGDRVTFNLLAFTLEEAAELAKVLNEIIIEKKNEDKNQSD